MKFIDQAKINVRAGNGGHGCIAFLREKNRPKGGPSGGDGGKGGDIILKVNPQLSTLHDINYKHFYVAERGQHGQGDNKHGKNGHDVILEVPSGTIVKDNATNQILCDLVNADDEFVAAKGGNGGFGNARFKTHARTAPRIANDGQIGVGLTLDLELKILADVGLVGFPNAGKSTFLSRVSAAKPKIADYPFTTLVPNLGIIKYGDYKSFVMADIPGLIEGASQGKGLGSQFLKHIERTKILVFLIDGLAENISEQYYVLKKELEQHSPDLIKNPAILLLTKLDVWQDLHPDINDLIDDIQIINISAVSSENVQLAIREIAKLIEQQKSAVSSTNN